MSNFNRVFLTIFVKYEKEQKRQGS